MEFTSFTYFLFLGLVFVVYYIIPVKKRYIIIFVANAYFLYLLGVKAFLTIMILIVLSYICALLIDKKKSKLIIAISIVSSVLLCKYLLYIIRGLDNLLLHTNKLNFDIILPVGISFYTLKIISYLVECYRGETVVEKNIIKYATYVSFFPQVTSGPIQRGHEFIPQIENCRFDYSKVKQGILLILLGVMQKLILAERCNIFVNSVYSDLEVNQGLVLAITAVVYSFQIYFDFSGYSLIVIGSAQVLGYAVKDNFWHPYTSGSIKEFWRRWHISFSSWLKDYIYIPLGGNRKGKIRKYINITITFLISGIWHGTGLTFIIWGGLHAVYQIVGDATQNIRYKVRKKMGLEDNEWLKKTIQRILTFMLVTFAWISFRANSVLELLRFIKGVFVFNPWVITDGTLLQMGLDSKDLGVLIIGILFVIFIESKSETTNVMEKFEKSPLWIRWSCYIIILACIFIFAMYGIDYSASSFIYQNF